MLNDPNNPNNFNRDEFNETLDQLFDVVKLEAQQRELSGAEEIIERLTQFCEYFEIVRNTRDPRILSNHEELFERLMSSLLDVPSEGASDSDLSISTETSLSASCEFSRLARNEVSLRKALVIWLYSSAAKYEVGDRLNDWKALIIAEQIKLKQIQSDWRETISLTS